MSTQLQYAATLKGQGWEIAKELLSIMFNSHRPEVFMN